MKYLDLKTEYDRPIAVALGFFDCIHIGHRLLVNTAREYSASHGGTESALFTFNNDPSKFLGREKQIYSFEERACALTDLGLDVLISTEFDENFAALSPIEFLDMLTAKLNIKAMITGKDYTFGKLAKGDVAFMKSYCESKGIEVITVNFEERDGRKISTTDMKNLVMSGKIDSLNSLLSEPYFMIGKVVHARRVGTKLGFPTANIVISDNKLTLADGVYATVLSIDGKDYPSMTNVGAKPTFGIESASIETYVLDFDGDIYDKTVKLSYITRLRDVQKFSSADALKSQLNCDTERVRELLK